MTYVKQQWIDDDGSGVVGTTFTAARMNAIERGIADAHGGVASPPLVTALPVAPVDGQEVLFLADEPNGIIWRLRYRALKPDGNPNPSAYKWEFVGGSDQYRQNVASVSVASTGVANDLGGPEVTLPLSGDYHIIFGARVQEPGAAGRDCSLFLYVNGAWTNEYLGLSTIAGAPTSGWTDSLQVGRAAGDVFRVWYFANGGTDAAFAYRRIIARPVRVG